MFKFVLSAMLWSKVSQARNPVFSGWYGDPDVTIYENKYWVFSTNSAPDGDQTFFDAFSSSDLITWRKQPKVLDVKKMKWAENALWCPSAFQHNGKYYLTFSAAKWEGSQQSIGISVADKPEGPYRDLLGKPLIQETVNYAAPICPFVFKDEDKQFYMLYGANSPDHCNLVKLGVNFTSLLAFDDGAVYKDVTPHGFSGAAYMIQRKGIYYFMWHEGDWSNPSVMYAIANSVTGPFHKVGRIMERDTKLTKRVGHPAILKLPSQDKYLIVYHRVPLNATNPYHRVICMEELKFRKDGIILPVNITKEGVATKSL